LTRRGPAKISAGALAQSGQSSGLLTHVAGVRIPHAPPAQMTLLTNKASSSVARSVALECASRRFVTRQARHRADLRVAVASRNQSTRAFQGLPSCTRRIRSEQSSSPPHHDDQFASQTLRSGLCPCFRCPPGARGEIVEFLNSAIHPRRIPHLYPFSSPNPSSADLEHSAGRQRKADGGGGMGTRAPRGEKDR
jgi:hypothetical protein